MMHYDWQWKKRYVQILLNCTAKPDASSDHMEKPLLGAVLCCTAIPPEQRVNTGHTTAITRLCIDFFMTDSIRRDRRRDGRRAQA